jgi:hypothetical protein
LSRRVALQKSIEIIQATWEDWIYKRKTIQFINSDIHTYDIHDN